MPELMVRLFGPASVEVDGRPAKLRPLTMAVLIRLIVAEGAPVPVDELFRDCWPPAEMIVGDHRTQVQKRILEIRRVVDPEWSGKSGREAQLLPTQRGRITAYRLAVAHESIDVFQFIELVTRARRGSLEERIDFLEQALSLWAGQPFLDVADKPWAGRLIRQLGSLRLAAEQELAHAYELVGRAPEALKAVEELAAKSPQDADLSSWVAALRGQVRASQSKRAMREDLAALKTAIVVLTGDLFAQDDANLVVGFCDTYDTDVDRNIVISGESTQGILLRRLYDGDQKKLDRELKSALSRTPKVMVESKSAKPRGKRIRYPVGTVATLHHSTWRVFGVAYSRMGNDLMAQSSLAMIQAGLENLWEAVYRYGQRKPIAMPLIGSGLSRTDATYDELLTMIVGSFAVRAHRNYLGPELRVIVKPSVFDELNIAEVLKSVRDDNYGVPRHGGNGK